MKKYFISLTDEDGILLERFRIIDSSLPGGMAQINDIQPGEEDAETETIPMPMAVASLVDRLQRLIARCERENKLQRLLTVKDK